MIEIVEAESEDKRIRSFIARCLENQDNAEIQNDFIKKIIQEDKIELEELVKQFKDSRDAGRKIQDEFQSKAGDALELLKDKETKDSFRYLISETIGGWTNIGKETGSKIIEILCTEYEDIDISYSLSSALPQMVEISENDLRKLIDLLKNDDIDEQISCRIFDLLENKIISRTDMIFLIGKLRKFILSPDNYLDNWEKGSLIELLKRYADQLKCAVPMEDKIIIN